MEYTEYKKIIDDGMVEYINNGNSTFYIGSALKDYVFDFDNPQEPYDHKKNLIDKAIQSILKGKPLPEGIKLVKCTWIEMGRN